MTIVEALICIAKIVAAANPDELIWIKWPMKHARRVAAD